MEEDNHNSDYHHHHHHSNGLATYPHNTGLPTYPHNCNGLPTYPYNCNGLPTYPHNNNNNNNNNNSDGGIHWLPPGFRFHPTDEELVSFYLVQKMHNPNSFAHHPAISEVDLNKCEPWDLPG